TNGIIQSIGMKLNEVDQDFGQKIQGLDQAMRKTDNKCKDLEDRIAKFDINGSDQLIKIEEFGKTLQNLINEKAKEKEEKKLQHLQLLINKFPLITAANQFKKPVNCNVFSLYYFELKLKLEEEFTSEQKSLAFGLDNNSDTIKMWPLSSIIRYQMQGEIIPQVC
uniref:EF-hand domain-containing protein n=1 Tax=Meloidogyne javanica TaxID=6303 RepID=A0A915LQ94_MELJA